MERGDPRRWNSLGAGAAEYGGLSFASDKMVIESCTEKCERETGVQGIKQQIGCSHKKANPSRFNGVDFF